MLSRLWYYSLNSDGMEIIMNIDSSEFITKRQGYQLSQLGSIGVVRVRAHVYVDAYRDQSRARLEVWSPTDLRWNICVTVPSEVVFDAAPSYALPKDKVESAVKQRTYCERMMDRLVHEAELVLGVTV